MKVLFASLSRIGDYIQHLAVVRAWSIENPTIEVHILVNDLIPMDLIRLNWQFKHIVLPRFEYQNRINRVSTPLLYPFWGLKKLVQQLRSENYIQLFDLSFQSHSLAFLKLIKPGFGYTEKERLIINQFAKVSDEGHLIDKIKAIYDLEITPRVSLGRPAKRVLFQVTTSDAKKNVDLKRWRMLLDNLKVDFSNVDFLVLTSVRERQNLKTVFSDSEILVCTFQELANVMDSNTRLVSLDTSIKHFAAEFQVPTVEISVGSSHWIKNSAYQSGNVIFNSEFYCRPCVHSVECPLGRNQCQDEISFKELQLFITGWIVDSDLEYYPMKTILNNGNLGIQRGEKWIRKTNPINLSL